MIVNSTKNTPSKRGASHLTLARYCERGIHVFTQSYRIIWKEINSILCFLCTYTHLKLTTSVSLPLSHTHTHTDTPSLTLSQIYFPKPSPLLLFFPPFSPPPLSFRSLLLRLRFTVASSPISHLSPLICYTSSDQATSTLQHLK